MTRNDLESRIREALTRITRQDARNVPTEADLAMAIGLDSLGRLELLAEVEDMLDVFFLDLDTADANSIGDFIAIAGNHVDLVAEERA